MQNVKKSDDFLYRKFIHRDGRTDKMSYEIASLKFLMKCCNSVTPWCAMFLSVMCGKLEVIICIYRTLSAFRGQ